MLNNLRDGSHEEGIIPNILDRSRDSRLKTYEPPYGPLNPHPGQVYSLPKRRHLSHRQMVTLPHAGHWNLTAFSPGAIFLPQDIQDGISLSLLSCR